MSPSELEQLRNEMRCTVGKVQPVWHKMAAVPRAREEGGERAAGERRALTAGDLTVQLNLNDYLDIYCPHYPDSRTPVPEQPETLVLYLVEKEAFKGCVETKKAVKRWECNTPFAPFGPVRFSEKIQRFTPFSLGFEFLPGRHYYYSSLPTDEGPPLPCMKMRVTVCCEHTSEGSKQIQETKARSSVVPLRTASLPLLISILLPLVT
uniref:Ephrin-A4 n=1 Tax=Fundulus heteroclitus TaxID=8078 RepID=A0A3Q2PXV9_FUNHE